MSSLFRKEVPTWEVYGEAIQGRNGRRSMSWGFEKSNASERNYHSVVQLLDPCVKLQTLSDKVIYTKDFNTLHIPARPRMYAIFSSLTNKFLLMPESINDRLPKHVHDRIETIESPRACTEHWNPYPQYITYTLASGSVQLFICTYPMK